MSLDVIATGCDLGKTVTSVWPKAIFLIGAARIPKIIRVRMVIVSGLRITNRARSAQRPSSFGVTDDFLITQESILFPRSAKVAGRGINAPSTANATTAMPAYPKDLRKFSGKSSNEASVTKTVRPEKKTVRPAVATVLTMAS